jgi:hypothetical protein
MPQTGPQPVTKPVGDESGLAVDQSQRAFLARRDAKPAAVTEFLVDGDNLADHGDTPVTERRAAEARVLAQPG